MNAGHLIRLARLDEVERLGKIEAKASELFADTDIHLNGEVYEPDGLTELIGSGQVWVACLADDVAVGFVIVLKMADVVHVEELDVLPEFGRRGIGAGLLEHVCQWAPENGFTAITLSTFRDIPWNAPFYLKHGFRILPPDEFTPQMIAMRATQAANELPVDKRVIMRLELSC